MRVAVIRKARVESAEEAFAVGEDRTFGGTGLFEAAGYKDVQRRFEEENAGVIERGEEIAGSGGFECASAEGENEIAALGLVADGFGLEVAKGGLSALGEDLGNGFSGAG